MRIAIMESIITPGGHEVDFDRILVEEMKKLGHEVVFYIPEKFVFKFDYNTPVCYLPGTGVSYAGLSGVRKIAATVKREFNRQRWFKALYEQAQQGAFDAIIIPTSTYRYLRALNMNILRKSPVPVIFILHGVNPQEAPRVFKEAEKLKKYKNIKLAVLTFENTIFGYSAPNIICIKPPTYTPRDIELASREKKNTALKLGFFGQYRKEKKLDVFLDMYLSCNFTEPVELLVQGATVKPEDSADFERLTEKYSRYAGINFLHKSLIGRDWQEAIAGVDALLMPYSAERYLYHWSAMLFTAIGYYKPVIVSGEINPEVLAEYNIGMSFKSGDNESLKRAIEDFVNNFKLQSELYMRELVRANTEFSPAGFAQALIALMER